MSAGAGMRVVVVTFGSLAVPRGGLCVRTRMAVETLTGLGAKVEVISSEEPTDAAMLGEAKIQRLTRRLRFGFSLELVRRLRALPPDVDAVVVASAMFLPAIAMGRVRAPLIWDTNECETLHYLRARRTLPNLARLVVWWLLETWAARRSAIIVSISDAEVRFWRKLVPGSGNKLIVVPHTPPSTTGPAEGREQVGSQTTDGRFVIFVGNLLAKHNLEAARWLADDLAARLPEDVRLVLAGPGTEALAGRHAAVLALGWVEDVDSWISAAELCLAPLATGAGVKTKVLHYLRHGKLVVGTPVAFEGIEDAPGTVSSDLAGFTTAVLAALADPGHTAEIGSAQQEWLARAHGGPAVLAAWDHVLELLPSSTDGRAVPARRPGMAPPLPASPTRQLARVGYGVARRVFIGTGVQRWSVVGSGYRRTAHYLLPSTPTMVVPFLGTRIELPTTDTSMALGLRAGTYERTMREVLARALRPGHNVLDVGANVGLYTVAAAARVAPSGAVVAVEPLPEAREFLARNLAANDCRNVTVLPVAAGAETGRLQLRRFGDEVATSSAMQAGDVETEVELARLDDLLPDARFDVIKIDIEGYEYQALRGMEKILERSRPLLFLEYNDNHDSQALIRLLRKTFPYAWRADERRGRVVPIEYDDLQGVRQVNIIASAEPEAMIGLLTRSGASSPAAATP